MRKFLDLTICALFFLGAGVALAAEDTSATSLLRQASFSDLSRPGLLRVRLQWGEVQVRGHDGLEVQVQAAIVQDRNLPVPLTAGEVLELVQVELVERDNVMDLVIDSRLEGFHGINLEILVPVTTDLALEVMRGGNIFVTDVHGEVDVSNRNGSVTLEGLSTAAVVDAQNGSIAASFVRVDPSLPMSFATMNGSVDITFPPDIAADLYLRYNRGGVESDYAITGADGRPLQVDPQDLAGRETRTVQGSIRGGGPSYSFRTANGTIYLRRG